MAGEVHVYDESYTANADLSAKQFFIVADVAGLKCDVAGNNDAKCSGVLQNAPKSGRAARVRHLGISRVVSDGSGTAIVAGDKVGPNASGKAIKKVTNNDVYIGTALEGSAADGTVILVRMTGVTFIGA
jgi:hypothetical protein